MKNLTLSAFLGAVALLSSAARGQLAIAWSTIDGGGGTSGAGALVLNGTIGQPDAGPVMSGGSLAFRGGFWPGIRPPAPPCGTADFNNDGDVGTDQDIEAFFRCLAGTCCPTCFTADFNGDGDVGTDQDIEAFFRVLAGGNC